MTVSYDQRTAVQDGVKIRFLRFGEPGHPNNCCEGCVFCVPTSGGCCHATERACVGSARRDRAIGGIWVLA